MITHLQMVTVWVGDLDRAVDFYTGALGFEKYAEWDGGPGELRAEVSTTIKRPVEEVFAVMSDASRNPQWLSSVSETTKTSDGPIGVGTTWHGVGKFLGRRIDSDTVYTEFEPNRKLTFEATTPFPMTIAFTFESVSGETRVTQVVDAEPGGFFKLAGPLLVAAAKRQFKNDLDTFRDLMEGDALAD